MCPPAPPISEPTFEARGWVRSDDRTETVFEGLGVVVESRTLVYEDADLRAAVTEAGGPDRIWRFLFVSRLEITPSPVFGIHAAIRPHVLRESKRAFAEQLHGRDIERIETGDTDRTEVAGDRHARVTPYRGTMVVESSNGRPHEVAIIARLVLWYDDGFYIAGCASPSGELNGWTTVETDGEALVSLIQSVLDAE